MDQQPAPLPEKIDEQRLFHVFQPSMRDDTVWAWDLEAVRSARDAQMRGDFRYAAPLAEAMKTDAQIFGALLNRLVPHRRLARVWSSLNARVTAEAKRTFDPEREAVSAGVVADQLERVVQHGLSVGQLVWTPRQDGSRVDVQLVTWPMSSVRYDWYENQLTAQTTAGTEPIRHGDGKWVVAHQHAAKPWEWGTIKAVCLDWPARAYHKRDRTLNSETHGEGKFIGTLDEKTTLNSKDGKAFAEFVESLRKRRSGGIKAFGTTIELLEAMSQMWQIFREAIASLDKDIARAYLGQDGSLVNEGGNYIKAAELAGVRYDLVEGDLSAISGALKTGVLRPWSLVNFGRDLDLTMKWALPDPDEHARREDYGKRTDAFNKAIKEYRDNQFVVDQDFVNRVAEQYGIDPPTLAPTPTEPPKETEPAADDPPEAPAAAA